MSLLPLSTLNEDERDLFLRMKSIEEAFDSISESLGKLEMSIWHRYPEIREESGLTYPDLYKKLNGMD